MKVLKTILLALMTAVTVGAVAAVAAQPSADSIRQMLENRDREIKTILGEDELGETQRAHLQDLINGVIDFEVMSALALGHHWDDLSAEQQTEFVSVFGEIVRAQSLANLDVYRARVEYGTISFEGNLTHVETHTTYKDVPTKVMYIMSTTEEPLVHDIILDDVSTVEGYARSFQPVIRKKGFESLMTSLRKKRDRMDSTS